MLLYTGKHVRACVLNVPMLSKMHLRFQAVFLFFCVLMIKFNWIVYHLIVWVCLLAHWLAFSLHLEITFCDGEFHWILSFILWLPQANMLQIVLHSLLTFFCLLLFFFFAACPIRSTSKESIVRICNSILAWKNTEYFHFTYIATTSTTTTAAAFVVSWSLPWGLTSG